MIVFLLDTLFPFVGEQFNGKKLQSVYKEGNNCSNLSEKFRKKLGRSQTMFDHHSNIVFKISSLGRLLP